jgi:hypothetical protein
LTGDENKQMASLLKKKGGLGGGVSADWSTAMVAMSGDWSVAMSGDW